MSTFRGQWASSRRFFQSCYRDRAGDGPGDTLKRIKEQFRAVPQRGIRFGLLEYLHPAVGEGDPLKRDPAAEISFNYLGRFDGESRSPVFTGLAAESAGATQSSAGMRRYTLEINGILNESQLELSWNFSTQAARSQNDFSSGVGLCSRT